MLEEIFAFQTLTKAVDFLFGEARKILEERRQERQNMTPSAPPPPEIPLLERDKASVLQQKVSGELVKREEQAVQGLLEEIAIYQGNYQHLKNRAALEGGLAYSPPAIKNQLHAQEDEILQASEKLATIIERMIGNQH